MAASKRQTTMAKLAREQSVRERRVRKQEKRDARKLAKAAGNTEEPSTETSDATGTTTDGDVDVAETDEPAVTTP